jgi:hypothetical protein
MAEEFTINSAAIETKINQLLPSQGGFQPGVDFSASTMVIPIVDLTETAEGSSLRQDLQTALSLTSATAFSINNANTNIVTTTGYFRITAHCRCTGAGSAAVEITDGTTTKALIEIASAASFLTVVPIDLIVFSEAGDSISINSSSTAMDVRGSVRQIADLAGNLVNP